jgi:hypothetical protein
MNCAVRQRRVLLAFRPRARLERLGDFGEAVAPHDVGDADGTGRVTLESKPAVEHFDIGGGRRP